MKFWISYFYNIRFLKPNQIPVSTAVWDPKWYHNFKGNSEVYLDKNGVLNGLRVEELNPQKLNAHGCPCKHKGDYKTCRFLREYREGLRRLNFQRLIDKLELIGSGWKNTAGLEEEPEIVLIVYEVPDNPCSERVPLIEWFAENGIELEEWKNVIPN